MKTLFLLFATFFSSLAFSSDEPPAWAYPVNPPNYKPEPDNGLPRHVPDSTVTYMVSQTRDLFMAPDWHPEEHPPMPQIVALGRRPKVFACGVCHRASGTGGPENSSMAGLPAAYFIQQMADFKSGARKTSVPKRNVDNMIMLSKEMTDDEVKVAADYFSKLKPRANIKVIETAQVPKTAVTGFFLSAIKDGGKEELGHRIIEIPNDVEQFESRDSHSQFTVYAPKGSIKKGASLVKAKGNKAVACATCHGPNLKGVDAIPSIAGRSPSYIVRQLYDFQHGVRAGAGAEMMKAPLAMLTTDDMTSIAAYLASLER